MTFNFDFLCSAEFIEGFGMNSCFAFVIVGSEETSLTCNQPNMFRPLGYWHPLYERESHVFDFLVLRHAVHRF